MHSLLVAIDGSASATNALAYAIRLASKSEDLQLHVITVFPKAVVYGEIEVFYSPDEMRKLQHKQGEEILKPAIQALDDARVPYTTEIVNGDIPRTIVDKATALGCDGIIMGTRGTGPVANLMMGSVATKVVHLTKLPVTLVH